MLQTEIHDHARKLRDAHGDKAIAEAARKAVQLEKDGHAEQARDWRRIESALKEMHGPHAS